MIANDLETGGSLRIHCKPLKKPEISPVFVAWNDLETAINNGELYLSLHGINTIVESKGFNLKGEVTLISSHLTDPVIFNSRIDMSSIRARTTIMNSKLRHLGLPTSVTSPLMSVRWIPSEIEFRVIVAPILFTFKID